MINAYRLFKVSKKLYSKGFRRTSAKIDTLNVVLNKCVVYGSSDINIDTKFSYGGIAFIIHKNAKIASGCTIGQNTTIGMLFGQEGSPQLEENVYVGPGARILGEVTIGHNSIIAPNAVVNKSTPPYSVIGGVPARVIGTITKDNFEKYKLYGIKKYKM